MKIKNIIKKMKKKVTPTDISQEIQNKTLKTLSNQNPDSISYKMAHSQDSLKKRITKTQSSVLESIDNTALYK